MNNLCNCAACNRRRQLSESGLKEGFNPELTDEEKKEIRQKLLKILHKDIEKQNQV